MNQRGFTLIEVLIVMAVLSVLMGMLMPALAIAKKSAAKTNTMALLKRVEIGLHHFKEDIGTYPFQDNSSGYPTDNLLGYHLAHNPNPTEAAELQADAQIASSRYLYFKKGTAGSQLIQEAHTNPLENVLGMQQAHALLANRMASERARMAIYSGNTMVTGLKIGTSYNFSTTQLVPAPSSLGWCHDYLGNDLPKSQVRDGVIIDRWNQPLVYVCPVTPGVRGSWVNEAIGETGSNPKPRAPVSESYYGMLPVGRTLTSSMNSDIRTTAACGYELTFELWSKGPDKQANEMRNDRSNADNISATPYIKTLK